MPVIAALVWLLRGESAQRADILKAAIIERASLLTQLAGERAEWKEERTQLLNRLQVPGDMVSANHSPASMENLPAVGFDDDEDYHNAQENGQLAKVSATGGQGPSE